MNDFSDRMHAIALLLKICDELDRNAELYE